MTSNSNGRRVAVTGMGFITPIGNDVETVWSNLVEGVSGIGPITHFDTTGFDTKIAGEVKGFNPEEYMDRKTARHIGRYCQIKATSERNDEPEKACRPFDLGRDGFVMSEGSVMLVLEDMEHAKKRGARILAEIAGYGATADMYHFTAPQPEGKGAMRAMRRALEKSGVELTDVGYINAHGTSTKLGDVGAIEAAACILALDRGLLPPTINLDNQDPECDLDYVPNKARKADLKVAVSNSFGFGGHNATLVIKGPEGH